MAASSPRSSESTLFATDQPSFTVADHVAVDVRAPSRNTSLKSGEPPIMRIGRTSTPGWSIGTRKNVRPRCLLAVGSVRASTKIQFASMARVCQIFWP